MDWHRRTSPYRVVLGDEHSDDWQRDIERARVFFVLLTPRWLNEPRLHVHLEYAKRLGKPVRVAVIEGTPVPAGLFAGIADLELHDCASPAEASAYVIAVVEDTHAAE